MYCQMWELVLVDVRMPGIGGVEAARRILSVVPQAAVIMMTMAEDVDGVARAVNAVSFILFINSPNAKHTLAGNTIDMM